MTKRDPWNPAEREHRWISGQTINTIATLVTMSLTIPTFWHTFLHSVRRCNLFVTNVHSRPFTCDGKECVNIYFTEALINSGTVDALILSQRLVAATSVASTRTEGGPILDGAYKPVSVPIGKTALADLSFNVPTVAFTYASDVAHDIIPAPPGSWSGTRVIILDVRIVADDGSSVLTRLFLFATRYAQAGNAFTAEITYAEQDPVDLLRNDN